MGYLHTFYEEVKFSKIKTIMHDQERNYHNKTNLHLQISFISSVFTNPSFCSGLVFVWAGLKLILHISSKAPWIYMHRICKITGTFSEQWSHNCIKESLLWERRDYTIIVVCQSNVFKHFSAITCTQGSVSVKPWKDHPWVQKVLDQAFLYILPCHNIWSTT